MMKPLLLLIALSLPFAAAAEDRIATVTTKLQASAEQGKGAHLRDETNALGRFIAAKQFDEANDRAIALCKQFEAMFDPAVKQFVFRTRAEYDEFKKSYDGSFEWIDSGYQQCRQMQAFVAAERRDFPTALAILKSIEALVPQGADSMIETGYILGQLHRPEEGLAVYRRALGVVDKYRSQEVYRAAALRGAGFMLIELNRLDEAERALNDSLKVEPGNKGALNELSYIKELREKK